MTLMMPMVRIRLKCPSLDAFVDKYRADVNMTGIFVRTRSPLPASTPVTFDFRLADDSCLFRGCGVVVWARADDTLAPLLDPGMMLSFDDLRDGTREHFDHVLARKRALDEAADTVPTLVRSFSSDPRPLPMTTKLTAEQLEELRSRMREQMAAEGDVPPPPAELVSDAAPMTRVPMLVPAEPRQHIEAIAAPAANATATPLARVLVLRPQPEDELPTVDPDDITPLPPAPDDIGVVAPSSKAPTEITELVACPPVPRHSARLIGFGIAGGTLAIGFFALIRLNLAQRILEWISGA